jgi:hypothetical protein
MLRQKISQRTHLIRSVGAKSHILHHFGPFRYCMKVDAKMAEPVPVMHKFAKQCRIRIFRNESTRSTPLDLKLMFWAVSDRFVTAQKSMRKWPNKRKFAKQSDIGKFRNERN